MKSSTHISQDMLSRWARLELDDEQASIVENHLLGCDQCASSATLDKSFQDNPVVSFLKDGILAAKRSSDTLMEPSTRETQVASNLLPQDLNPNGDTTQSYKRISLHGAGGIGEIWKATDKVFHRIVALKNLNQKIQDSHTARARFLREAIITAQLQHPGIVPVYSLSSTENELFYTMRLIEGQSLLECICTYHFARRHADEEGHADCLIEFARLLRHYVAVCETIAYAHSRRVIHRDIKSDNVIIGDYGEVVLLDWGLAKYVDEVEPPVKVNGEGFNDSFHCRQTIIGQRLGTPAFMSPEQARGEIPRISFPADIWGLSAMLYEILCGEPPYSAVSSEQTMRQVIENPVTPCHQINPDVPPELEELCLAGLNKNPEQRPYSAKQIGERVASWLDRQFQQKQRLQERQNFFNISSEMMAILHPRKGIQLANNAWTKILGWQTEELLGKTHVDLVPPEHQARVGKLLYQAGKGRPAIDIEVPFYHRNGREVWTMWTATPYENERRVYVIGRDISERKRSRLLLTQLFDAAPDAMVVLTPQGILHMVNSQAIQMFGFQRQELLGQSIEILLAEKYNDRIHPFIQSFLAETDYSERKPLEVSGRTRSGSEIRLRISLSPITIESDILISAAIRKHEIATE